MNNDITSALSCNNRFAFRQHMTNVDGHFTIDYIANFLSRVDLRERMVADGLLCADGLPSPQHAAIFAVVESNDPATPEVLVTPDGACSLYRRYGIADGVRVTHQAALAIQ